MSNWESNDIIFQKVLKVVTETPIGLRKCKYQTIENIFCKAGDRAIVVSDLKCPTFKAKQMGEGRMDAHIL